MAFVNEQKKESIIPRLGGWPTLVLLVIAVLSAIYVVYRYVTGEDPLRFIAEKRMIFIGVSDDQRKGSKVTYT